MNKIRDINKQYGITGSYIILNLQILCSKSKDGRVEISDKIISDKWNQDWMIDDNKLIRRVISTSKNIGLLSLIEIKSKFYIEFDKKYVIKEDMSQIKHTNRQKRKTKPFVKPKDWKEVEAYVLSKGVSVKNAETDAYQFYNYWESLDWTRKGGKIKNWKATMNNWLDKKYNQN